MAQFLTPLGFILGDEGNVEEFLSPFARDTCRRRCAGLQRSHLVQSSVNSRQWCSVSPRLTSISPLPGDVPFDIVAQGLAS